MNKLIALLTKQFSKVVKKFKNLNTTGSNARNLTNYQRRDGESNTRRFNEISNKRDVDYGQKKDGGRRIFRCRECRGVGHFQAECSIFFRKQKKYFRATLSDEDTDDSGEDDNGINAFIVSIIETNSEDESGSFEENSDNEFSLEELKVLWKKDSDSEGRVIQKEKFKILGKFRMNMTRQ